MPTPTHPTPTHPTRSPSTPSPSTLTLATWNINSVRLRAPLIEKLTAQAAPDIVCLQETKCPDDAFPFDHMRALGYKHIHIHGMKSYNGQAILSKIPFTTHDIHHRVGKQDCRHISVSLDIKGPNIKAPVHLHNLYIPAGGDEPDPTTNDKFKHKLDFIEEMTHWFPQHYTANDHVIAVGDFNIAPYEHDVWSHKQLLKIVSHTPAETDRLNAMRESLNWVDTTRHFIPHADKAYSWWSYRNRDWKASNRGRRLDHIWVTPPLKATLESHTLLNEARDWDKPSDHIPVIVTLKI